ncbi:transcriptional activator protein Pur-alpha-like isoform X2 [Lineus longissimus]|uniref:transcriptional activator protein Pur-alpha-like isoform X2 n=1 Tax=Lineus longissimus TaxID=88925 RepID=UPI00315DB1CD
MSDRESGDEQQDGQARASSPTDSHHGEQYSTGDVEEETTSSGGEQELATRVVQIQQKRFYLDVKQNRRGRFIKIAEVKAGGKKSRILMSMSIAAEFRDYLSEFSEHYAKLGPQSPENIPEDGKIKSETIVKDNRRYYLDLKENERGRFLRVRQIWVGLQNVSTVIPRKSKQQIIAIPAQGLIEFRDALTDLLLDFGTSDQEHQHPLPESRSMRVENKTFYFDVGSNRRGVFMRISEVRSHFRTAITIPERSWAKFRDIMCDFSDQVSKVQEDDN